jgi:hypothetical protein
MKTIRIAWLCLLVLAVGCGKQPAPLAQGWSAPHKIAETEDSLVGSVVLFEWHNRVLAMQPKEQGSARCFLLNTNGSSWAEVSLTGVPRGYSWYRPAINPDGDRVLFDQSYKEDDQLVIAVLVGRVTVNESVAVRDAAEKKWLTNTKALFGDTSPNVKLSQGPWPVKGVGQ